ncbi:hypothetical protein DFH94DRAFT_757822 [Russula ochroleuca]|uniref:B30.2/SPRY domain-containing protein n=1 Tax=Russula ochroleuca TaxID=152965 RepID=A0A9P5T661_9AGAM|nr:hypothetical protein DFH94DRAFT_757822 [Russula ochroleuca]
MPSTLFIPHRTPAEERHPPPVWKPASEKPHKLGLFHEASDNDYEQAIAFCTAHRPTPPKLLPSDVIDRIRLQGCAAWGLERPTNPRFIGHIERGYQAKSHRSGGTWKVRTEKRCRDTCVMSDLPLMAGLYDIHGRRGIYYEVRVNRMEGVVAIGTACKPYPSWRLPGWNRLSAGWHLDDLRKFFEDPDGGRDYTIHTPGGGLSRISPRNVVGCGYEFGTGALFFTHNGRRLPNAFVGIYRPRVDHDVYATIGFEGANEIEVNFGTSDFLWKEGNDVAWRVDGHVGYMVGSGPGQDERLPSYSESEAAVT